MAANWTRVLRICSTGLCHPNCPTTQIRYLKTLPDQIDVIIHVTTKAQMKQSYRELCAKSKNVAVEVEPLEWSEATRLPRWRGWWSSPRACWASSARSTRSEARAGTWPCLEQKRWTINFGMICQSLLTWVVKWALNYIHALKNFGVVRRTFEEALAKS